MYVVLGVASGSQNQAEAYLIPTYLSFGGG